MGRAGDRKLNPLVPITTAAVVVAMVLATFAAGGGTGSSGSSAPAVEVVSTTSSTTIPTTTTTTTTPPDPIDVSVLRLAGATEAAPTRYQIDFSLIENGLAREETWIIERPYRSLVRSTRDGQQIGGSASSDTNLYTYLSDRESWLPIQAGKHRASFDTRVLPMVGVYDALGLFEEIGTDTIAGRDCTLYRTGPPMSQSFAAAPTADESTEICVDGEGLLLREKWSLNGNLVVDRVALAVTVGLQFDQGVFDPEPIAGDAEEFAPLLTTIVRDLDPDDDLLNFAIAPPEGWTPAGAVLRTGVNSNGIPGTSEAVHFYERGPDLVEVNEIFLSEPANLGSNGAISITGIDGWDEAYFVPIVRANVLRVRDVNISSYVEIEASSPGVLLDFLPGITRLE